MGFAQGSGRDHRNAAAHGRHLAEDALRHAAGLCRDGLVSRRAETSVPPRVYYGLTDPGLSLEGPPAAVRQWAGEHMAEIDRAQQPADERAADS
jgi:hypothetical protein